MFFLLLLSSMFFMHMQAASSDDRQLLSNKHETMTITVAGGSQFILAAPECAQFSLLLNRFRDGAREIEIEDVDGESFGKIKRWVHLKQASSTPYRLALSLLDEVDLKWNAASVSAILSIVSIFVGSDKGDYWAKEMDRYISPYSNCLPGGDCDQIIKNFRAFLKEVHRTLRRASTSDLEKTIATLIHSEVLAQFDKHKVQKIYADAVRLGAPVYIAQALGNALELHNLPQPE